MDFRILGPLEVADAGVPVAIGGPRERTVLAVLLLRANRVVPVADLVDALWPGRPPATARQQIQTTVSLLRRSLGDPVRPVDRRRVITGTPGYRLRVEAGELDADVFAARVLRARADRTAGQPARAADGLRDALALWRGRALDGHDAPAVRSAAAGLDERRMAAVEDRAEAGLAAGRHAEVVAEVAALAVAYPLRERLHGALMVGLYRLGRQAEALRVYRDYRRLLVAELGVEPGPPLRAVQRAILCADPALEHPGPARVRRTGLGRDRRRYPARHPPLRPDR
jgi:DNA-binding SARP family transcriptional activator